jgi:FkbM family methyltransferase
MNLHQKRLGFLKSKGFSPKIIYDIGAHKGNWTNDAREIFPHSDFFLFEANRIYEECLAEKKENHFIYLLGDEKKETIFYSLNTTGDSVFRENTSHYSSPSVEERILEMQTLSSVIHKHNIPLPHLIKMDVQGAETLIIKGSPNVICQAEVVILETKVLEYNQGAPSLYETIDLMHSLHYAFSDILEFHYLTSGELNELDILFIKKDSVFIPRGILNY